jgi:hypothetical protein
LGSGGGIRTPGLWVMSPTSCRCSTPRWVVRRASLQSQSWRWLVARGPGRGTGSRHSFGLHAAWRTRGGLASRGVAPAVLSGAAAGHDRVRDGTGWDRRAPGHGSARHPGGPEGSACPPPPPPRPGPRATRRRHDCSCSHTQCAHALEVGSTVTGPRGRATTPPTLQFTCRSARPTPDGSRSTRPRPGPHRPRVLRRCRPGDAAHLASGGERGTGSWGWWAMPPSAMSTARLRSVARRPPAASPPGGLPGALLHHWMGGLVLGRGSRLDAFSGSPVRA